MEGSYPMQYMYVGVANSIIQSTMRSRTNRTNAARMHSSRVGMCTSLYAPYFDSLYGYLTSSSFLSHICFFFLDGTCSTQTCFEFSFMNRRMNLGSHSSLATPKSLQHRIRAFDLQPSVAVGIPSGEKKSCSPRAMDTNLQMK